MPQHYLTVKDIRLSVIEHRPELSPTIFFVHGNSISSRAWDKQVADPRFGNYRLVTMDLPAHGDSGTSADPATDYSLPGLGAIMAEAIVQLAKGPYIICGISLGTNVVAEMIPHGITPAGILHAGACVMGKEVGMEKLALPGEDNSVLFKDEVTMEEVRAYGSRTSLSPDGADKATLTEDFFRVKTPFRSSLLAGFMNGKISDEITLVRSATFPQAWAFGADERVVDPHYLDDVTLPKWRGKVFLIPGASHLVNIDAPEAFNALLGEFAREVFGAG
jgi:pimeloyl-ACP methyl ester carboxylesterase